MAQIDVVRNNIGGMVNNCLANGLCSPTDMRYVLKAILGEVAEMELTQLYASQQMAQKDTEEKVDNGKI